MSIDWAQVLEKPDKSFKVPGTLLLQQRNKIEKLQNELEQLKAAKKDLEQEVAALKIRNESVVGELEAKNKKITEQDENIDKLKEVLAGLEDNLATQNEEKTQLTGRITELENSAKAKDEQLSEQSNKIAELEAKINELTQQAGKVQELEGQVADMAALQGQILEKDAKISELGAKAAELEAAQSESEGNIGKKRELLEQEKNSFEEQYKLKEAEVAEQDERFKAIQADMQKKIDNLQAKVDKYEPPTSGEVEARVAAAPGVQSQIPWKSGTGVHVCPDCGSNRTTDMKDKSKVLYVAAGTPIYAKKKRCLNCGADWAID